MASDKLARLWSSFDAITPDVETIEFLHALTRLVKPRRVLETRTWVGLSACAIGRALVLNGFGHLTTLEANPEAHAVALKNIELAVFDLTSTIPLDDLKRFVTSLVDRAIIVVHANSDQADDVVKFVQSLAGTTKFEGLTMPTPRGIFIGCINRHLATGSASELS